MYRYKIVIKDGEVPGKWAWTEPTHSATQPAWKGRSGWSWDGGRRAHVIFTLLIPCYTTKLLDYLRHFSYADGGARSRRRLSCTCDPLPIIQKRTQLQSGHHTTAGGDGGGWISRRLLRYVFAEWASGLAALSYREASCSRERVQLWSRSTEVASRYGLLLGGIEPGNRRDERGSGKDGNL
jgi:hypothetical protein